MKNRKMENIEKINMLRSKLEIAFVEEKIFNNYVSSETVRNSQELDILISKEQKRRLEELKKSKSIY